MKILNTDGLVLFGPGSEWLWFMLQFLALATTFYAIYRQLRLQASHGAVEQVEGLNREYDSERMLRYRLAIAVAERDEIAYPLGAARAIVNFWEGLGGLVRKGHLDANLYWDSSGSNCQTAWASLEPFVHAVPCRHGRTPDRGALRVAGREDVVAGSPGRHGHRHRSGLRGPASRSLDRSHGGDAPCRGGAPRRRHHADRPGGGPSRCPVTGSGRGGLRVFPPISLGPDRPPWGAAEGLA